MTNNRAERAVKPFVIVRKNFLFSDTSRGADASVLCFSMIESAKLMHDYCEEKRKMEYTSNYRLKLPAKTDVIDITVLNSNLSAVDAKLAALEKKTDTVQLSDTLEIISASGSVSFYHGTATPFNSILQSVK